MIFYSVEFPIGRTDPIARLTKSWASSASPTIALYIDLMFYYAATSASRTLCDEEDLDSSSLSAGCSSPFYFYLSMLADSERDCREFDILLAISFYFYESE